MTLNVCDARPRRNAGWWRHLLVAALVVMVLVVSPGTGGVGGSVWVSVEEWVTGEGGDNAVGLLKVVGFGGGTGLGALGVVGAERVVGEHDVSGDKDVVCECMLLSKDKGIETVTVAGVAGEGIEVGAGETGEGVAGDKS